MDEDEDGYVQIDYKYIGRSFVTTTGCPGHKISHNPYFCGSK